MIVVIINLFILTVLAGSAVLSFKKKKFYLFSPFCFPFIFFAVNYIVPSTLSYIFLENKSAVGIHHILYFTGILSFISGVFLSNRFISHKEQDDIVIIGFIKSKDIPLWFLLSIGITLLIIYGIGTGITKSIISGRDVEDLRRTAEIGKGYIKDSGLYLSTVSGLWLIGNYINPLKKSFFGLKGLLVISIVSVIVFLTVGHKAATLLPVLIIIGLYNRYRNISIIRIAAIGCCFFLLIGFINTVRSGGTGKVHVSDLMNKLLAGFNIYEANYVPIVNRAFNGKIDRQYGKEYFQSATSFIPRFLYPDKPVSFDYFLKKKLNRTFKGGGLPPTPIGSLYLNFGFFGVISGMLLISIIYNYLFELYLHSTYTRAVILLFAMYYIMSPSQFFRYIIYLFIFMSVIALFSHFMYTVALSQKVKAD